MDAIALAAYDANSEGIQEIMVTALIRGPPSVRATSISFRKHRPLTLDTRHYRFNEQREWSLYLPGRNFRRLIVQ